MTSPGLPIGIRIERPNTSSVRFSYFVRTRDWYFIQFGRRKSELYDVTADPEQIHDVADEHPALVQRFAEMIRSWSAENSGVSS